MSEKSDIAKIEFIIELIDDINRIVNRHGGTIQTLDDYEGRHAIMMCLMQTGETLNKIESQLMREKLPIDLAYKMRNIIAHDYIGVNKKIIAQTIELDIPVLYKTLKELVQFLC